MPGGLVRKFFALLFVIALALAAVGCSSDGSDGAGDKKTTTTAAESDQDVASLTADDYEAALVANLSTGNEDEGALVMEQAKAECLAPLWLDAITVDVLQANDVTVEQISDPSFSSGKLGLEEAQGQAMVDGFDECDVDVAALLAQSFSLGLEEEQQACVAENIDPEMVDALLVKAFSTGGGDAEFKTLTSALGAACDLPA